MNRLLIGGNMSRNEMIFFVEEQIRKGLSRIDSIKNLAFFLEEDDPESFAELWFQQKISGE